MADHLTPLPDVDGVTCVNLLEHELFLARKIPPREVLVLTIDVDGDMHWSYTHSDDLVRVLGLLEMVKAKILARAGVGE
jgi:hypothetical protein